MGGGKSGEQGSRVLDIRCKFCIRCKRFVVFLPLFHHPLAGKGKGLDSSTPTPLPPFQARFREFRMA